MSHPDRCETTITTVGPFKASVCFHPETKMPVAVFIVGRGKVGHELDDHLRNLGIEISKIMQGE